MRKKIHTFSIITFTFSLAAAQAEVTQRWVVETSRVQPAVFDAVRGETLSLEAAFQSYGKAIAMPTNGWCILWQTNGMGSAWWQEPAEVERKVKVRGEGEQSNGSSSSTNYQLLTTNYVVKAAFTPAMDPGADTVIGFLGATGQNYRASFRIRFRHGPGERPNTIAAPVPILDLAHTTVINPPWPTAEDFAATTTVMKAELKDYVDGQIECAGIVTPQAVTNIAGRATSNVVTKAYVESLGISGGGITTNDVNAIIASSNLCTVAAAQAMTNDNTIVRGVKNESTWDIRVTEALSADEAYEANYASVAGVADDLSGNLSWTRINTVEGRSNLDDLLYEDFYMKSQIDGTTVTNGGAKAYADAKFLPKNGGNVSGNIVFTTGLSELKWYYKEGENEYEYSIKPSTYPLTYKGFALLKTKNPGAVPGREDVCSHLFIDGTDFATLATTTNVVNGMIVGCVKHSSMYGSIYVMTNEMAFAEYPGNYRPLILSKKGMEFIISKEGGGSATNNIGLTFSGAGPSPRGNYRLSCDYNGIGFVADDVRGSKHNYLTSYLVPDGSPVATSNMVERVIASKPAPSPLTGKTYDFANGSNFAKRVYAALTNVIQTLGGTVANPPSL